MVGTSALAVAGASGLLKLVRQEGATTWVFPEAKPTKAAKPAKPRASPSSSAVSQKKMEFEHDAAYGECVGTLRWSERDAFPVLSPWHLSPNSTPPTLVGWRDYLEMRLASDASGTIKVEPPMIDGLSYPLSLVFALQKLRLSPPQPGPLFLLIVGASSKAEERLMRETSYWHELLHFFPKAKLELVFVGPEIAAASHGKRTEHAGGRLTSRCFHGTLGELLNAEPRHNSDDTIVVGYNTGMGNASAGMAKGGFALMTGWLPDLIALLRLGLVAVFTCANDYSDLRGELVIFSKLLHAQVVLPPQRNPFKAATVVRESHELDKCEWSCSSCFLYAVCGREEGAPSLPPPGDAAALEELKKLVRKTGKMLAQTQTPSAVP